MSDYEQRWKLKVEIEEEIGIKDDMEGVDEYKEGLIQLINIEEVYGIMFRSE